MMDQLADHLDTLVSGQHFLLNHEFQSFHHPYIQSPEQMMRNHLYDFEAHHQT